MEVLDSGARERPAPVSRAAAVGVALGVLVLGQGYALTRDRGLPAGVELAVAEGGYTVATSSDPELVSFQLDNQGQGVDLVGVVVDVPGVDLVDVVAAGSATGGKVLGEGDGPLPRVRLGESVILTLRFDVTDCAAVDSGRYPIRLQLRDGRRAGEVALPLRDYPDLSGDEGPDLRWQQVLAFAACP